MVDERQAVTDGIAAWAEATAPATPASTPSEPSGARPALRSVTDGAVVELREVTGETVRDVCRLQVLPSQRGSVAPNAVSFAEALFEPKAWYRAVYADERPVGFVMIYEDRDTPEYFLWRFMIAGDHQHLGYGRRALDFVVEHVRTLPGAAALLTSWVPGPSGPEAFYRAYGFEPTGEVDEGEIVGRLALS